MTITHTRTHVAVEFANPWLRCTRCGQPATGFHDPQQCGCDLTGFHLEPCEHKAGALSVCPSWSPVDGCQCADQQADHQVITPTARTRRA